MKQCEDAAIAGSALPSACPFGTDRAKGRTIPLKLFPADKVELNIPVFKGKLGAEGEHRSMVLTLYVNSLPTILCWCRVGRGGFHSTVCASLPLHDGILKSQRESWPTTTFFRISTQNSRVVVLRRRYNLSTTSSFVWAMHSFPKLP